MACDDAEITDAMICHQGLTKEARGRFEGLRYFAVDTTYRFQAALQSLREIRGMSAALHFEPDLPALFVDAGQIQQILENLLLNAADAAGSEGEVRLDIHRDGAWVELQVSDSGPGIEPQVRARIFEPLVTTKPSGVGLGLTLCRKLALANEGVLELSEGPLPGAAFSLRLPVG